MPKVITLTGLGRVYGMAQAAEQPASVPLNLAVAAGAGALVGLLVASGRSKKVSMRLVGAGAGAAIAAFLLAMTWPKQPAA